eukprot:1192930-Prorocentrum_minimum.AAC.1
MCNSLGVLRVLIPPCMAKNLNPLESAEVFDVPAPRHQTGLDGHAAPILPGAGGQPNGGPERDVQLPGE